MQTLDQMISSTPNKARFDRTALSSCLEACVSCELACVSCADACLGEKNVDPLRRCIRLNQDCADFCGVTARVLSRQLESDFGVFRSALEACALACAACAAECDKHAGHHEHCRICAAECRRCEAECRKLLRAIPQGVS